MVLKIHICKHTIVHSKLILKLEVESALLVLILLQRKDANNTAGTIVGVVQLPEVLSI